MVEEEPANASPLVCGENRHLGQVRLSGGDLRDDGEADSTFPGARHRRSVAEGISTRGLAQDLLEHRPAAVSGAETPADLRIDLPDICRLHDRSGLPHMGALPWLQVHRGWRSDRLVPWAKFDSEKFAPVGPKPFSLEAGGEPGGVKGHELAFDASYALPSDGSDALPQEDSSHTQAAALWRHAEARNDPNAFRNPIVRVADRMSIHPHSLTWQASTPYDAPQRAKDVRHVPPEPITPAARLEPPETLQLRRRDRA